jgi:hypothetical protein
MTDFIEDFIGLGGYSAGKIVPTKFEDTAEYAASLLAEQDARVAFLAAQYVNNFKDMRCLQLHH